MIEVCAQIIAHLCSLANPANAAGMVRYGIGLNRTLGLSVPMLRTFARRICREHELTARLPPCPHAILAAVPRDYTGSRTMRLSNATGAVGSLLDQE